LGEFPPKTVRYYLTAMTADVTVGRVRYYLTAMTADVTVGRIASSKTEMALRYPMYSRWDSLVTSWAKSLRMRRSSQMCSCTANLQVCWVLMQRLTEMNLGLGFRV
jgi:hypothetical protein